MRRISRRRALSLIGAAGLGAALGGSAGRASAQPAYRWRGAALGARAELVIHHRDRREAARLVALARDEIDRLEGIFSLYRPDSALVALNRAGRLEAPPLELVAVLDRARVWHGLTAGAFDVTVQPLWQLYGTHFAAGATVAPRSGQIAAALGLVGQDHLVVGSERIVLGRPGMALTLNGIAQGYITDRVADLWRAEGLDQVLIDLGELRALGDHPEGRPWQIGLRDAPGMRPLALTDAALATSSTAGFSFDRAGRAAHLLDPRTGRAVAGPRTVSVIARSATDADALSTGLLVGLPEMPARDRLVRLGIHEVLAGENGGTLRSLI